MFQQMKFLGLVVKDIPAATKFYTERLGFTVNEQESVPDFYTQFELNGDPIFGLVNGFEPEGLEQSFDAALLVEDVDAAYAELQAAGVELVGEPHDMPFGRTFFFRTPDGHVLRVFNPPAQG